MNSPQETYEKIEKYLSGQMTEQERLAFEQLLQANEALRKEVALQKDMNNVLSDVEIDDYLSTLTQMRPRVKPIEKQPRNLLKLFAFTLLGLFISLLVWNLFSSVDADEKAPSVPTSNEVEQKKDLDPTTIESQPSNEETITPVLKDQKQLKDKGPVLSKSNEKLPMASNNFVPNGKLELLIGGGMRSSDEQLNIEKSQEDLTDSGSDFIAKLNISGSLSSAKTQNDGSYVFYLYSNDAEVYEKGQYLLEQDLVFFTKGNVHHFNIDIKVDLSPGLYYYIIEAAETEEPVYVNRFEIR